MQTFERRMKVELLKLEDKIDRLSDFISRPDYEEIVSEEEQTLLDAQYHAMVLCHSILKKRCQLHGV